MVFVGSWIWRGREWLTDRITYMNRHATCDCRAATGAAPGAKDLLDVYLEAEEAEGEGSISNEQMLKTIFDVFLGGAVPVHGGVRFLITNIGRLIL